MIRYALACNKAHPFESWFPSSEAYDAQRPRATRQQGWQKSKLALKTS
jgi:hypothetical protein